MKLDAFMFNSTFPSRRTVGVVGVGFEF